MALLIPRGFVFFFLLSGIQNCNSVYDVRLEQCPMLFVQELLTVCWVTHFHLPFMSFLESLCESSYLFLCYPLNSFCKLSFFFFTLEKTRKLFL